MRSLQYALVPFVALVLTASAVQADQEVPLRAPVGADTIAPSADSLGARVQTSGALRTRFVRDQTALGLAVYAPAFAGLIGADGVTGVAGYLVMAGGTFFAAAEMTRRVNITESRHLMSSAMGLRGAGSAYWIASTADLKSTQVAAVTLLGGIGGTASGLYLGGGLTAGEAAATIFGFDLAWLSAYAITAAGDPNPFNSSGVNPAVSSLAWTASGVGGYVAGRWYTRRAPHNVTVGDVQALWVGAAVGALGGAAVIGSSHPTESTVAVTLLSGGLVGTVAAERLLVRRYDHSRGDGNLLALGGGAGALMGMGIGVLISGSANRGASPTLAFATTGAVGGIAMAERFMRPASDAGRLAFLERITLSPTALVAFAARQPGQHSLVHYTF